jgi:hypothetical protein
MATILEPMGPIRRFTHDVLGWHKPNEAMTLFGINLVSYCRYCDRRILQDSQGGWFEATPLPEDKHAGDGCDG